MTQAHRTPNRQESDDAPRFDYEPGELTEYERGYVDGLLAASYRTKNGDVVLRRGERTYKAEAEAFLHKQGHEGWKVNVV